MKFDKAIRIVECRVDPRALAVIVKFMGNAYPKQGTVVREAIHIFAQKILEKTDMPFQTVDSAMSYLKQMGVVQRSKQEKNRISVLSALEGDIAIPRDIEKEIGEVSEEDIYKNLEDII